MSSPIPTPALSLLNDRYELQRLLGEGGMGTVHLVKDLAQDGRFLALKRLQPRSGEPEELALFEHEFRLLAGFEHPNLNRVHDFGVIDSSRELFFTTEFIDGEDLYLAAATFDWDDYYEATAQIARALAYVHSRGLVHQDVKPSNILVRRSADGLELSLIDFGLASIASETALGSIRGTVSYLAPELGRGSPIDRRVDLYSLGVTLYHCVTRQLPFQGETTLEVLRAHLEQPAEDPEKLRSDLPAPFAALIRRLMEKDPAKRFSSAEQVILALSDIAGRDFPLETAAGAVSYINSGAFVGREDVFTALATTFDSVVLDPDSPDEEADPLPSVVLIRGDVGVGKTRLMSEFRRHVQLNRIALVEGRSIEDGPTYGAIIDGLRGMLRLWSAASQRRDSRWKRLVRRYGGELSRLLPELAPEVDEDRVNLQPGGARLRLFDHLARFLLELSRRRPVVLMLPDLHLADVATREFVAYLARNLGLAGRGGADSDAGRPRLMLVASLRAGAEADELGALESDGDATLLELGLLDREGVETVVRSMLGAEGTPEGLGERVYSETRGNPFFIVELMKSLVESGQLCSAEGRWSLELSGADLGEPRSMREVILERVCRLEPAELDSLRLLATWGRPITAGRFAALSGSSTSEVLGRFGELSRRHVLAQETRGEERLYEIAHRLVLETIYRGLEEEPKEALHRRCGLFLEEQLPALALKRPAEVARHFERCGDRARALGYAVCAADEAQAVHANARAIELFGKALELLEADADDGRREEILEHLGALLLLAGDAEAAGGAYRQILSDCGVRLSPRRMARIHRKLGEAEERRGRYDEAMEAFAAGFAVLGRGLRSREGAKLLGASASISIKRGRYEEAVAFCESALGLLRGFPGQEEAAEIRTTLGVARERRGDLRAAEADFSQALAALRRAGNRVGVALALTQLGSVALESGRYDEAIQRFEGALSIHETLGHRLGVAEAATHLGRALAQRGQFVRALAMHRRALSIQEHINDVEGIVISENDLGWLSLGQGDYGGAKQHFERALGKNKGLGELREAARAQNGVAELSLRCGCLAEASAAASEALRLAALHELPRETGRAYRLLARLAREAGDEDSAEHLFHRALTVLTKTEGSGDVTLVTLDIIDLYARRGDVQLAQMALEKLESEAVKSARLRARIRLSRALVAAAAQEPGALEEAQEAVSFADESGDRELAWWSRYLLGELYESQARPGDALAAYVVAMERVRELYASLPEALRSRYLELPRRRLLRESFQRVKRASVTPGKSS